MKTLLSFLGGAAVGAVAALLLAPEKGEDLRARIAARLRSYGALKEEQIADLVDEIAAEVTDEK